jgi:hypothetical protein
MNRFQPLTNQEERMKKLLFFVVACVFVFCWVSSKADIPKLINYQGMLTDVGGTPLTDTISITFQIWTDSVSVAGIDKRWEETQPEVEVIDGLFNVALGRVEDLELDFSEEYWLDVTVAGEHMPGRVKLASVGYAYRAWIADSAVVAGSGGGGGGGWADEGAVVRLETAGDSVGIGTTSPAAKLDVSGDININSVYKIEGETVLYVDGDQNTFVGQEAGAANAGGYFNTFIGNSAGHENQDGARNTFLGKNAGYYHRSGVNNTFLGYYAGYNHRGSAGDDNNVFVGHFAGYSDTSGTRNTFLGVYAGYANIFAYDNTFVGQRAGYNNKSSRNTFLGCAAGEHNDGGYNNTYAGGYSGWNNVVGNRNAYVGYGAGYNGGGSYEASCNTYLGYFAGRDSQDGDSNVFIGREAGAGVTASNKLIIANGPDTANMIIYGDFSTGEVGIGTTHPTERLDVNGTARLRGIEDQMGGDLTDVVINDDGVLYKKVEVSSRKYKQNIRNLDVDLDEVLKLQSVRFEWTKNGTEDVGLIAEDVQQAIPDLVRYNSDGSPEGVRYDKLALFLLEALKAQQERISALEQEIAGLKR